MRDGHVAPLIGQRTTIVRTTRRNLNDSGDGPGTRTERGPRYQLKRPGTPCNRTAGRAAIIPISGTNQRLARIFTAAPHNRCQGTPSFLRLGDIHFRAG